MSGPINNREKESGIGLVSLVTRDRLSDRGRGKGGERRD